MMGRKRVSGLIPFLVVAGLLGPGVALWLFIGPGNPSTNAIHPAEDEVPGTRRTREPAPPSPSDAASREENGLPRVVAEEAVTGAAAEPRVGSASLEVWLVDKDGRRRVGGGVQLWHDGSTRDEARRETAAHDEPARFVALEPGEYRIAIEPGSLSPGWVPAHPEGWSVSPLDPEAARVRIDAGERREEPLWVRRAAHLLGTVFGPDGVPVPYATVRLQWEGHAVGRSGNLIDIDADDRGNFAIELTPGLYLVHVLPGPTVRSHSLRASNRPSIRESPIYGVTKPLPRWQRLEVGETARHDIRFGLGRGVIRGRVVDERSEPVPGLRTIVYPCGEPVEGQAGALHGGWGTAVRGVDTDAGGRFSFEGLEDARYAIQTGLNGAYSPREPPGTNLLGDWPQPVHARIRKGEELDIGDLHVVRSHPFVVRGRVVSASGRSYAWRTVYPEGWRRRTGEADYALEVGSSDGSFSWFTETPEGPVRMQAVDERGRVVYEEVFHPEPDGEVWKDILVP